MAIKGNKGFGDFDTSDLPEGSRPVGHLPGSQPQTAEGYYRMICKRYGPRVARIKVEEWLSYQNHTHVSDYE